MTGFADALDDRYFKKKGVKDNSEVFGLSNWVNQGTIYRRTLREEKSRLCPCECREGIKFKNSVLNIINLGYLLGT